MRKKIKCVTKKKSCQTTKKRTKKFLSIMETEKELDTSLTKENSDSDKSNNPETKSEEKSPPIDVNSEKDKSDENGVTLQNDEKTENTTDKEEPKNDANSEICEKTDLESKETNEKTNTEPSNETSKNEESEKMEIDEPDSSKPEENTEKSELISTPSELVEKPVESEAKEPETKKNETVTTNSNEIQSAESKTPNDSVKIKTVPQKQVHLPVKKIDKPGRVVGKKTQIVKAVAAKPGNQVNNKNSPASKVNVKTIAAKPIAENVAKKRKLQETGPQTEAKGATNAMKKVALAKKPSDAVEVPSSSEKIAKEQNVETPKKKSADYTEQDILNDLDDIEDIICNSSSFNVNDETKSKEIVGEKKDDSLLNSKKDWYETKLQEKHELVKERLAKLARVLEFSYPSYKKWLNAVQTSIGTPVCRLKPPRRCSLEHPHPNRWKFTCNKIREQLPSEDENKRQGRLIWSLDLAGAQETQVNNPNENPPFVLRAVKVLENFLATTLKECEEGITFCREEVPKTVQNVAEVTAVDDKPAPKLKLEWLWLLVRCNRKDELMFFVTAKNLNAEMMEQLKTLFETGEGKDCNVKSLYCKSIIRADNINHSNTTFVMGVEALDEVVNGVKLQLGPKTNFWSNAAGAESLGNAICDHLTPTPKTTVVEIGCGIGLMGLMMSNKCQKIIGLDAPAEIEEAELISQLNNVKNASFVMGQPTEVMATIANVLTNCKASAIVNNNSSIGRGIDVMTSIRKISTLKRLVLVTTLAKQSVRSILELTRPAQGNLGNPFIPIRACVVDTLPAGPHFEAVILMERRVMEKILPSLDLKPKTPAASPKTSGKPGTKDSAEKVYPQKFEPVKLPVALRRNFAKKSNSQEAPPSPKIKSVVKRSHSPEIIKEIPVKPNKRPITFSKPETQKKKFWEDPIIKTKLPTVRRSFDDPPTRKPWEDKSESPKRKPWEEPLPPKRKSWDEPKEKPWEKKKPKADSPVLRVNPLSEKKSREPQDLRERLSASRAETSRGEAFAQKVKEGVRLISKAKEKINTPSVPLDEDKAKQLENMLDMVLEQTTKIHNQVSVWDRIAPAPNNDRGKSDDEDEYPGSARKLSEKKAAANKKYNNVQPLEPDQVMPTEYAPTSSTATASKFNKKKYRGQYRQHLLEKMNKMKAELAAQKRKSMNESFDRSPSRGSMSPERSISPRRRDLYRHSPGKHSGRRSPMKLSPGKRSPPRMSPGRHSRYYDSHHRSMSPKRSYSPMQRSVSPPRREVRRVRHSPTMHGSPYSRGSPRMSPPPRGRSPPPPHREMSPVHHHLSPPRRMKSPPCASPPRYADDWDIPSRGAIEGSTWMRPEERYEEKRERVPWGSPRDKEMERERYKPTPPEAWKMAAAAKPKGWYPKEAKAPNFSPTEKRSWSPAPGMSGENWGARPKEAKPSWMESARWKGKGDKDEWHDLPEDARDPWGDEGPDEGCKEILSKFNPPNWEMDRRQSWMQSQGMGQMMSHVPQPVPHPMESHPMTSKAQWPQTSAPGWTPLSDIMKRMQGMQNMQSMSGMQGMQNMQNMQAMPNMQGMQSMHSMQGMSGMQPMQSMPQTMQSMQGMAAGSWPRPDQPVMNPYHHAPNMGYPPRPGYPSMYPDRS